MRRPTVSERTDTLIMSLALINSLLILVGLLSIAIDVWDTITNALSPFA